jgi:hypothetical protein
MVYAFLSVILEMLLGVVAATILFFGFAFLIFLGDADARGRPLVSRGFDRLLTLVIYASWFAPLLWFGPSRPLVMVACAVTVILCVIYVASYSAARAGPLPGAAGSDDIPAAAE